MQGSTCVAITAWLLTFATSTALGQTIADAQTLRARVAAYAGSLQVVQYDEFVWGRFGPLWPAAELDGFAVLQKAIKDPNRILVLLGDADPKIRTLALMLLYDREDARYLPRIAKFVNDPGATFASRRPGVVAMIRNQPVGKPWRDSPCTVGDVARSLLEFYYRVYSHRGLKDATRRFEAWWRPRSQRTHCAGWLRVRFLRAYGGATPVRPQVGKRFARVRAAVNALPTPDRELLLIALPDSQLTGINGFATQAERVAAAKVLGEDVLLDAMAGVFSCDDPDLPLLVHNREPGGGLGLHGFLLDPTHSIFTNRAAERLLSLEQEQRKRARHTTGYTSAGWVTLAASLRPDRATEWLMAAFDRFPEQHESDQRNEILKALARFGDDASERAVVERFWGRDIVSQFGAQMRASLLDTIVASGAARAERLIDGILKHPSFDHADPQTMLALARAVGAMRNCVPISTNERLATHHPFGLHQLVTKEQLAAAKASWPAETAAVLQTSARWGKLVRTAWRGK